MLESIREELQKLKTDRIMLVACLIIPIVVNLLVGWQLGKGVMDKVPMAIVDYDNSQLSRQIISYFVTNDAYDVKYQIKSQSELEELINSSEIRAGMVIPQNFSDDVVALKAPTIMMLYDGSHMSLTSVSKAKASEILISMRVGASIKQLQARMGKSYDEAYNMAMPVSFVNRTLYNPTKNFSYFMTPGYGTIICQLGIGLTAVLCVRLRREEEKKRSELGYIAGKVLFYGLLGSLSIIINVFVQVYLFKIPCRGSLPIAYALSILYMFAVASLAVAISACLRNRVLGMAISGLLLIPNSILAGYTWPVISMLPFYKWFANLIPFTHYGDNLRDIYLKGNTVDIWSDIRFLVLYIVIMLLVATAGIYIRKMGKPKEEDNR